MSAKADMVLLSVFPDIVKVSTIVDIFATEVLIAGEEVLAIASTNTQTAPGMGRSFLLVRWEIGFPFNH